MGTVMNQKSFVFPIALVRKYNRPGPRYTSYPTALQFKEIKETRRWMEEESGLTRATDPFSLYLHLPFCQSACWFCGCTKIITGEREAADRYLAYLEKEITQLLPYLPEKRSLVQLHLGGGTPTFFSADQLQRLGSLLRSYFSWQNDCEASVEIDPRSLQREQVEVLYNMGFRRASLGVQDHNPDVQKAIHRIQPPETNEQAIEWLRKQGFTSVNVDLIYGLPLQTRHSFRQTVFEILTWKPDRIALFSYAHVPWIRPAQKIFDRKNNLPSDETKLSILEDTANELLGQDYRYVGMDHFALAGDELAIAAEEGTLQRNFQGYSTRSGAQLCALGMSAISQTEDSYRQNHKEIHAYYTALDQGHLPLSRGYRLSNDDKLRRKVIHTLMCSGQLPLDKLSVDLGVDLPRYLAPELASLSPFIEDGLVRWEGDTITVTPTGRFLMRNIAMCFDAYLRDKEPQGYSKTI